MDNAYDKGYQAYHDGKDLSDNPFKKGSEDYDDWEAGWVIAADEDTDEEEG